MMIDEKKFEELFISKNKTVNIGNKVLWNPIPKIIEIKDLKFLLIVKYFIAIRKNEIAIACLTKPIPTTVIWIGIAPVKTRK